MKLENDKIYRVYYFKNVYIVQCIDAENRNFKPLKVYDYQLNKYFNVYEGTMKMCMIKEILKYKVTWTSEEFDITEFDEFEILL